MKLCCANETYKKCFLHKSATSHFPHYAAGLFTSSSQVLFGLPALVVTLVWGSSVDPAPTPCCSHYFFLACLFLFYVFFFILLQHLSKKLFICLTQSLETEASCLAFCGLKVSMFSFASLSQVSVWLSQSHSCTPDWLAEQLWTWFVEPQAKWDWVIREAQRTCIPFFFYFLRKRGLGNLVWLQAYILKTSTNQTKET